MSQPSPYSGNETALKIAELINGLTAGRIKEVVWEARLFNAKDTQIELERIFDEKIQELIVSGCSPALIDAYLIKKEGSTKAMLTQCVHWEKAIPPSPFIFREDGRVNNLEWYTPGVC
ncbi:MAG: hypothetical protein WCJ51_03865 [Candidatus Moraniibacteriota bacterium]